MLSMPNENLIMDTKLHPTNHLHISNQAVLKLRYRLLLFIHKIQLDQALYDGTFWPPHESVIRTGM